MGALASTSVVFLLPEQLGSFRAVIAALAAFAAGGIWVLLPALMKNYLGISETVNTIMFNYIATMFVGIAIRGILQEPGSSLPQTASATSGFTREIKPVAWQPGLATRFASLIFSLCPF